VERYGRTTQATDGNIIQRMYIACCVSKATYTQSEYVILITSIRQQWLRERHLMLVCTCISCLIGVNYIHSYILLGHTVAHLVEVLHYKPEGRGFDSRWGRWNFSMTLNPSSRTMALKSTQPVTEFNTRNISWG
jgi:hypothetical protein